jgi:hypothetical protein
VAAAPITDYILTDNAVRELRRRGLEKREIDEVLKNPGQRWDLRPGRAVLQSKTKQDETEYLLRVFVDIDRKPAEVVTAYRTSKIAKYWRDEP